MFITFEGIEGTGKSTQIALLGERLRAAGYRVRTTIEPGGTPLADAIRAVWLHPNESLEAVRTADLARPGEPAETMQPITEALLISASRAQHVARMHEWLAAGEIVVSDRFADSTRAYQGYGSGANIGDIETLEQMVTGGLHPDLTILLDLAPTEGKQRKQQGHAAGEDLNWLDQKELAYLERVRAGYFALAAAEPQRWVVLDADQPQDMLAEQIWETVLLVSWPHRMVNPDNSAECGDHENAIVVNGKADWQRYFPGYEVHQCHLQASKWLYHDDRLWVFEGSERYA